MSTHLREGSGDVGPSNKEGPGLRTKKYLENYTLILFHMFPFPYISNNQQQPFDITRPMRAMESPLQRLDSQYITSFLFPQHYCR